MADADERETQLPTEPNEQHDLDLCLGLRPSRTTPTTFQNNPQISDNPNSPVSVSVSLSKQDLHAFRRQEAKRKRDLKRKSSKMKPEPEDCRKSAKVNPADWWSWNPATGSGGGGNFRAYQGQNGKFARQSISSGSSSGISDNYQSNSSPGTTTSSDVGSHSSHPHSQVQNHSSSNVEFQPNDSTISSHVQPKLCNSPPNHIEPGMSPKKTSQSFKSSSSIERHNTMVQSANPEAKIGKPPRPIGPTNERQKQMLAQMPYVSVTGNGPNGKTITGFLYRYTKAEVSIVCVCHGAAFSPTGFVEHAGGVDVEHPLKHIRVVPFALG